MKNPCKCIDIARQVSTRNMLVSRFFLSGKDFFTLEIAEAVGFVANVGDVYNGFLLYPSPITLSCAPLLNILEIPFVFKGQ